MDQSLGHTQDQFQTHERHHSCHSERSEESAQPPRRGFFASLRMTAVAGSETASHLIKNPFPLPCGVPAAILLIIAAWLPLAGCKTLGRHGPVPEQVVTSRQLSCQGVTAMETGRWSEAEELFRESIEASPTDSETRRHLAEVLWQRGAADDALLQIEAAVRLNESDATTTVRAGEMLLATGAADKALRRADQAISLDPQLPTAWALRGRVYWHLGQTDRALADLQRALQYAPESPDVLLDVAALYQQRGEHARCLTTIHHLLDTYAEGEEPRVALQLEGLALGDLGRSQEAVESLSAACRRGPPNAQSLYNLAQALLASGRQEEATAVAQQALAADASHEPSRQLLARLTGTTQPVR
jgi:tetratricopeptide (TPR) repeat protein